MKKRRTKRSSKKPDPVRRDGALCAAFVNAASPKRRAREAGPFATYSDLLAWGRKHRVVDAAGAKRLGRAAAKRPVDAALAVHRAGVLRELVERLLLALADGRAPDVSDVEAVNVELARSERRLVPAGGACRWAWSEPGGNDLGRLLWPVVLSAAEVLTSKIHRRGRRCGGQGCDLLFVDRSPGNHRKWCSEDACGLRARSHRRYHKTIKPRREERRKQRRKST